MPFDNAEAETFWNKVLREACLAMDQKLRNEKMEGGSTAIYCLVTETKIIVANVGDSRCVLVENGNKKQKKLPVDATLSESESANNDSKDEKDEQMTGPPSDAAAGEMTVEELTNATQKLSLSVSVSANVSPPLESTPTADSSDLDASASSASGSLAVVTAMSQDHKASIPEEQERVLAAKFELATDEWDDDEGVHHTKLKVKKAGDDNAKVDFTRSFGDFDFKNNKDKAEDEQAVIAVPEVRFKNRDDVASESYLVLVCDGVTDVKSNQQIGEFVMDGVHKRMKAGTRDDILSNVADDLLKSALNDGSEDNLSTVIVALSKAADLIGQQCGTPAIDPTTPRALTFKSPEK